MTFVGFDLHKRYITACALDATGEIIAEIRALSTAIEAVHAWLGAVPGPVTVGLEATLYWEWVASSRSTITPFAVRVARVVAGVRAAASARIGDGAVYRSAVYRSGESGTVEGAGVHRGVTPGGVNGGGGV